MKKKKKDFGALLELCDPSLVEKLIHVQLCGIAFTL